MISNRLKTNGARIMLNSFAPPLFALVLLLAAAPPNRASALTADLGSNGSYGPINVTVDTVIALPADGVIHATTINIAANTTLSFSYTGIAHPGVVLLATGNVVIAGTLDVSGASSTANSAGRAGPGGSSGGTPSTLSRLGPLLAPSYLLPNATNVEMGIRPRGGLGGSSAWKQNSAACTTPGAGGGGGGGSLLVVSNTSITVSGSVDARGGSANTAVPTGSCPNGTAINATVGEDGYVRLIAPVATVSGATVVAQGIRVDAVSASGAPTVTRGSVAGAGAYVLGTALVRFPTLPVVTIVAINGVTVAPSTALQVPTSTPNPFNVTVRVVGCTAPALNAVVHSRTAYPDFSSANTQLLNPTGDDNVVVSINTYMSTSYPERNSALLFPAVWCGTVTYP